jgi:hypothetical protein
MISRAGILGLALSGMLLLGAEARAIGVFYTTEGRFTGGDDAGTNVYSDAANGILITFNEPLFGFVDTPAGVPAQASLGSFDTTGTTRPAGSGANNFADVSSGFELTVFQFSPTEGQTEFVGTLQGRLHIGSSSAFVQFDNLEEWIGLVKYEIDNRDRGVLGRVNINVNPDDQLGRISTINARITPIPEPSTVILMGMGAVTPLALTIRNRRKVRASA